MMKTKKQLLALMGLVASTCAVSAHADPATPGYLLLTIEKFSSASTESPPSNTHSDVVQKYKILLDSNFLSQYKFQPTQNSAGTGMVCSLGEAHPMNTPAIVFTQWFQPKNGKIATWLWGEGAEKMGANIVQVENGRPQINLNFPSWDTIDSNEQIGLQGGDESNMLFTSISISAKGVPAGDPSLTGALLIPVSAADGSAVVSGDSQSGVALTGSCSFQNN